LKKGLANNIEFAIWFIETFSYEHIIKEFLVENPVHEMRLFIGGMIKVAMKHLYEFEEDEIKLLVNLHPDIEKCLDKKKKLPILIIFINSYLKHFKDHIRESEIDMQD
jgi:hypothetical protein